MAYRDLGLPVDREQIDLVRRAIAAANLKPGPGGSCMVPVRLDMPGFAGRAQFVALWPSRQIVGHTDPPIPGRRYHIPIDTNANCWVFHGGEWMRLEVGHWYEMDPTVIHGAVNWGSTVRVHLMIDVP